MIAAVIAWHEHHPRAFAAVEDRLAAGEEMVVAAHTLVEAYAVLTRWPTPLRLAPADALDLLERAFVDRAEVVAPDTATYLELLRQAPAQSVAGGRIYDAVVAASARQGRATTLLTFNERHFLGLVDPAISVVVPP
jgi:predicted nucleic acid-binding protein